MVKNTAVLCLHLLYFCLLVIGSQVAFLFFAVFFFFNILSENRDFLADVQMRG